MYYLITNPFYFSLSTGTVFNAHKVILAACSKNFADLFERAPVGTGQICVMLEATSADNMHALLEFMYKGEVHVSQKALESFLKAAENLQVNIDLICMFFRNTYDSPSPPPGQRSHDGARAVRQCKRRLQPAPAAATTAATAAVVVPRVVLLKQPAIAGVPTGATQLPVGIARVHQPGRQERTERQQWQLRRRPGRTGRRAGRPGW